VVAIKKSSNWQSASSTTQQSLLNNAALTANQPSASAALVGNNAKWHDCLWQHAARVIGAMESALHGASPGQLSMTRQGRSSQSLVMEIMLRRLALLARASPWKGAKRVKLATEK